MNKAEQKQKISEFITRGELIGEQEINEFAGVSQVKGPQYETWMSEINVFNERHLKDHPLYSDIHNAFFHRNTSRKSYQNMMGHLKALESSGRQKIPRIYLYGYMCIHSNVLPIRRGGFEVSSARINAASKYGCSTQ